MILLTPRSGKVELKWTFEKGSILRYELTHAMLMDRGERGKIRQTILLGMRMEITDVKDRVAAIRVTLDRIKVEMAGSEYDSEDNKDSGKEDVMAKVMAAMVGKSFEMSLKDTGEVVEVRGCSDTIEKILKDVKDDSGMSSHLKAQFNDAQIRALVDTALPCLPKEVVAEGGRWNHESVLSIHRIGQAAAKSKFKVTGISGKIVNFKTKTTLEFGEGSEDMHGSVDIWDAGAEGNGTWDGDQGRLTESKMETKVTAEAHGQEFEIIITSTMKWAPTNDERKGVGHEDDNK